LNDFSKRETGRNVISYKYGFTGKNSSLNENLGSGIVETDSECDKFKQNDLHQAVEGIYKRLESIEERLCNNTGSKVASLQQTYTSSLESDIRFVIFVAVYR
jgi:hypothetical protein